MIPETQNRQNTQRKPYAEPRLRVYGDIREITQSATNTSMIDSAFGTKT